jgi:hypothetical protein
MVPGDNLVFVTGQPVTSKKIKEALFEKITDQYEDKPHDHRVVNGALKKGYIDFEGRTYCYLVYRFKNRVFVYNIKAGDFDPREIEAAIKTFKIYT